MPDGPGPSGLVVAVAHLGVTFFMPFHDFEPPAIPHDIDTYTEYRRHAIEFIEARNRRIGQLNL